MKRIYYLIISLIVFINFSGCSGYKPLYSTSNFNFTIEDYSIDGNKKISNQIYLHLNNIVKSNKNNKNSKKISISIDSNKSRSATAKSSTGKIIEYRINLKSDIPSKYLNSSAKKIKNKKKVKYFKKYINNSDFLNKYENLTAGIITPDIDIVDNANKFYPAFIVFNNYEIILKWNRSLRFGLAVCTLRKNFSNVL